MQKKDIPSAAQIQGFDAELSREKLNRIDRLVDSYETNVLLRLDNEYEGKTKWTDRLADRIAAFGGSWTFILIFGCFLALWIVVNTLPLLPFHFDPQPFILLNLCLSFIAAFQAPIIMMSQNRQAARDKHESVVDFAINYKAEQEIDDMQGHLHRMEAELTEIRAMLLSMKNDGGPQEKETQSK